MKISNKLLFFVVCIFLLPKFSSGQAFIPAIYSFSKKKTAYIHLEDGTKITCTIKKLSRKKGQIEDLKLVDMDDKKVKIKPEQISHMYLPPSNLGKFGSLMEASSNIKTLTSSDLDGDILSKGYVYLEKSDTRKGKKTFTVNLQLVNPDFSEQIRVYIDPYAKETMGLGIGGVDLVGGIEKSYYVKKTGEKVAFRLMKKDYGEEFKMLFGDCPTLMDKYGDNPTWSDLAKHIYEYTEACGDNDTGR